MTRIQGFDGPGRDHRVGFDPTPREREHSAATLQMPGRRPHDPERPAEVSATVRR